MYKKRHFWYNIFNQKKWKTYKYFNALQMKDGLIIKIRWDGNIKVDVSIQNEDIWMSQDVMANLYDTTKQNISYHLNNIFKENELNKDSVVKDFLTTANDGKKYSVLHYNLDAIIAVGYRINSKK